MCKNGDHSWMGKCFPGIGKLMRRDGLFSARRSENSAVLPEISERRVDFSG